MVKVVFTGLMGRYLGETEIEVELPDGATVYQLVEQVSELYRKKLPESFLRDGIKGFIQAVRVARKGDGRIHAYRDRLEEGEEVLLFLSLAGG